MRHVHSDIPAVEFASPLNAETQNTFTILTSGVSSVFTYSARKLRWNLLSRYSAWVCACVYEIRYSSCNIGHRFKIIATRIAFGAFDLKAVYQIKWKYQDVTRPTVLIVFLLFLVIQFYISLLMSKRRIFRVSATPHVDSLRLEFPFVTDILNLVPFGCQLILHFHYFRFH